MSISYDPILALGLPADGDESWGTAVRQNFSALAAALAPTNGYLVSPQFTDANLHHAAATTPNMFSTIQAALDAVTETGSYGLATIYIYPGHYAENLYITSSAALIGVSPVQYRGMGPARGALISGVASLQSPTVTIYPPESDNLSVMFANLSIQNQYNATAGAIAKAQILRVAGQTLYGSLPNYVAFRDCNIRAQTWGLNNDWLAGIMATGWVDLSVYGGCYAGMNYAGGAINGGINSLFNMTGNNAGGKSCSVTVNRCALGNDYSGATATPGLFKLDNRANANVSQSPLYKSTGAYAVLGATGTNTITGTGTDLVNGTPATMATYGNLPGINLAIL